MSEIGTAATRALLPKLERIELLGGKGLDYKPNGLEGYVARPPINVGEYAKPFLPNETQALVGSYRSVNPDMLQQRGASGSDRLNFVKALTASIHHRQFLNGKFGYVVGNETVRTGGAYSKIQGTRLHPLNERYTNELISVMKANPVGSGYSLTDIANRTVENAVNDIKTNGSSYSLVNNESWLRTFVPLKEVTEWSSFNGDNLNGTHELHVADKIVLRFDGFGRTAFTDAVMGEINDGHRFDLLNALSGKR